MMRRVVWKTIFSKSAGIYIYIWDYPSLCNIKLLICQYMYLFDFGHLGGERLCEIKHNVPLPGLTGKPRLLNSELNAPTMYLYWCKKLINQF